MSILIACMKGCGVAIEVSDEDIAEMKKAGVPVQASHEVCPTEEGAPRTRFRVVVTVFKEKQDIAPLMNGGEVTWNSEELLSVGGTVEAQRFSDATEGIIAQIGETWNKRVLPLAASLDT